MATFHEKLQAHWDAGKFVCAGLDPDLQKVPEHMRGWSSGAILWHFNRMIIKATHDLVCAYKPNLKFYLRHGVPGVEALEKMMDYLHDVAPDVPLILDVKDMDIGNTNEGSIEFAFEILGADAITVNPYMGMGAAQPFLDQKDKGIIVLCRTSNLGASEFQDNAEVRLATLQPGDTRDQLLRVENRLGHELTTGSLPLYQYVAFRVAEYWNGNGNCALVVGATCPQELAQVRQIVVDMPLLIPGIGAQGGDVEATVKAGQDSRGQGMIINASRSIIHASSGPDFAEAARRETQRLHNLINQYRN